MSKLVAALWHDDRGAAAAEYAIMLAAIGAGIATAANALSTSIATAISNVIVLIDG